MGERSGLARKGRERRGSRNACVCARVRGSTETH